MKNSDMKVIAIILSIALLFTIITSNAVSIASVILLSNGAIATETVEGEGDNTGVDNAGSNNTLSNTPSNNTSNTPSNNTSNTPSNNTSNTPSGNTSNNATGNNATGNDAGKTDAGNNAGNNAGDSEIEKNPLAAYKKAAADINQNGVAGYTKKSWQGITRNLELTKLNSLSGTLTGIIEGFMTKEDAAEEKVSEKGSDDAKRRMPASNCSDGVVSSATAKNNGDGTYTVTIVMKDQLNPAKTDTDGLTVMSVDFLFIEDVAATIGGGDIPLIKSLDKAEINYKAYTITAKMNSNGQFIDITHYCDADLAADITTSMGSLGGSGGLSFNVHYYNFQY